jgi:hypothetical protein
MHSVYNPNSLQRPATDQELEFQLNWLLRENELAEHRSRSFTSALEEEEFLLMRCPVASREAYARFGLLLGTLPPAAIFLKIFGRVLVGPGDGIHPGLLFLLFLMNVFCAVAGLYFGAVFGAIFAVPVGMLAFLLFVPLHRLLACGGMIDSRHLWPLACGVVTLIAALILAQ